MFIVRDFTNNKAYMVAAGSAIEAVDLTVGCSSEQEFDDMITDMKVAVIEQEESVTDFSDIMAGM